MGGIGPLLLWNTAAVEDTVNPVVGGGEWPYRRNVFPSQQYAQEYMDKRRLRAQNEAIIFADDE